MKRLITLLSLVALLTVQYPAFAATDVINDGTLGSGVVSCWTFDESSNGSAGVTRNDSKTTNHLTDTNTTASAVGLQSNGADFEASNSERFNRAAQTWGVGNAWTWNFWIKPETFAGNPRVVFFGPNGGANNVTILLLAASGKMNLNLYNSSGAVFKNYTADTTPLSAGSWFMVTLTWDGTNLLGYINATSQTFTKTTDVAGTMSDTSRTLYLGSTSAGTAPTDGIVDEVVLWNRAISSGEVTTLHNSGAAVPCLAGATSRRLIITYNI